MNQMKNSITSIIIDESEDFDEPSFKLLKTLIGESHLNDMFIVGDPIKEFMVNQ